MRCSDVVSTRVRAVLVATTLLVSSGCYSLGQSRHDQLVMTEGASAAIHLWVQERRLSPSGVSLSAPMVQGPRWKDAVYALFLWPIDILASTGYAIRAPFDSTYDVRLGPLGAVLGIALPGITLVPFSPTGPIPNAQLTRAEFDEFVRRVRRGEGVQAYVEIIGPALWNSSDLPVVRVRLVDEVAGELQSTSVDS